MTILHLVRHGQTDWNRTGRIQGTADVPLNDTGRAQARDAAEQLRALVADTPTAMVSSDLSRARETAVIIAATLGLGAPTVMRGLRERSYGVGEGMTAAELTDRFGSSRADDIPGAESRRHMRARAVRAAHAIARDVPHAAVIAVSHGAFIRELIRAVTGDTLPEPGTDLPNGGGYSICVDDEGMRLLDDVRART